MDEQRYEGKLFGDISAITQFNRMEVIATLLARRDWHARLLNGSDYPLPGVVPLVSLQGLVDLQLLDATAVKPLSRLRDSNVLLFDFVLKRSLRKDGQGFAAHPMFETAPFFTPPAGSGLHYDITRNRAYGRCAARSLLMCCCCLPAAARCRATACHRSWFPRRPSPECRMCVRPSSIPSPVMKADMALSFEQETPEDFPANDEGIVLYPHLALSGGGANGAFGAGFLNGWSSTGSRPTFKVVTGVSTGALMAPFAFLGQPGDAALHEFYTTTASRDIFALGEFLDIISRVLFGEGIADTSPLVSLLERHVDEALLQQVALAHKSGRRLYIGTVDLDSQRFIIWNMGLIATSGQPDALQLFRKVMLASASIPIAFAPVFFDVEAGGRRYDEMHVDGAVAANVFYNGGLFSSRELRLQCGTRDGASRIST